MTQFKVLKEFKDIHTGEIYKKDQKIEISLKRSKEIISNLSASYISRIEKE